MHGNPLGNRSDPMNDDKIPDARPIIRRAAGAFGIICFLLAVLFSGSVGVQGRDGAMYVCAFMGVVLVTIALTGKCPWWKR